MGLRYLNLFSQIVHFCHEIVKFIVDLLSHVNHFCSQAVMLFRYFIAVYRLIISVESMLDPGLGWLWLA